MKKKNIITVSILLSVISGYVIHSECTHRDNKKERLDSLRFEVERQNASANELPKSLSEEVTQGEVDKAVNEVRRLSEKYIKALNDDTSSGETVVKSDFVISRRLEGLNVRYSLQTAPNRGKKWVESISVSDESETAKSQLFFRYRLEGTLENFSGCLFGKAETVLMTFRPSGILWSYVYLIPTQPTTAITAICNAAGKIVRTTTETIDVAIPNQ